VTDALAPTTIDAETCAPLVPSRAEDAHKGTFGTVVCICGSIDYAGAALLSGTAAARAGAGLVALAVPASLQRVFAGRIPELVTLALPEKSDGSDIDAMGAGHALKPRQPNALVFGSGIRESDGYAELLAGLLVREGAPLVVDGGGLNLLSRSGEWWRDVRRPVVLTPHPGEFARLMGQPPGDSDEARLNSARAAFARFGQVVVLKGARTVVAASGGRAAVAMFANAALASAGTGDVLGGTIGSLLAQGLAPYDAARLGVFLHGRAAQMMSERLGDAGLLASDLTQLLPIARRDLAASVSRKTLGFRRS
jgi:NAD(P)H-hydrate epimerase